MSVNHQYIEYSDTIVKRYTKTTNGIITGFRADPHRPENRTDWMLHTPERNFVFKPDDRGLTQLIRTDFTYADEVIELYSDREVKLFVQWNKKLIESGVLIEYEDGAPGIDTSNILSETEVSQFASTKQIPALRKRLAGISSIHSVERIKKAAEDLDRPISVIRTIEERINELSGDNTSKRS